VKRGGAPGDRPRSGEHSTPRRQILAVAFCLLLVTAARPADAQQNTQLWGELKLGWIQSRELTYGLDVEPKLLLAKPADDPRWMTLDLTPSVEFSRGEWLDVLGELLVAKTRQTDDLRSTEITPRLGVRLHLLSNLRELTREKRPTHRVVLRNLARLEWRNLFYSEPQKPNTSTLRFRDRVEVLCAVTRPRVTDDGATYLLGDAEWFLTLDDVSERFAGKQRVRGGVGYRHSSAWRFEGLVIWDRSRNTIDQPFSRTDLALDLVVKRVW
jgi:hypothetical protein